MAFAQRIMLHIQQMATHARQIHLEDNYRPAESKDCDSVLLYPRVDHVRESLDAECERQMEKETRSIDDSDSVRDLRTAIKKQLWKKKSILTMKSDCRNHVTRLSFNEYYFYPSKKLGPLQFSTFQYLISEIEKMAAELPENFHLTLASFPVIDSHNTVSNTVAYVQCGTIPSIQTFAKAIASNNEPMYLKTQSTEFCADPLAPVYQTLLGHKKSELSSTSFSWPILCKTIDTSFWTAIDICADHELGYAKQALTREINTRLQNGSGLIPEYVTHIVTSNSTFLYDNHILSQTVTHVDPSYATLHTIASQKKWQPTICKAKGTSGKDSVEIRCFPQREIDKLNAELLSSVQIYNKNLAARLADKIAKLAESADKSQEEKSAISTPSLNIPD
jgi:hypothetical protein